MILVIDNYDSFTYNLVQFIGEVRARTRAGTVGGIEVVRNDRLTLNDIKQMAPSHIVISPGPCTPNEAGISLAVAEAFAGKLPLLGVCLGHQAIAQAFGAKIIRAEYIRHGKTSYVEHDGCGIFAGIKQRFVATRYHSLVVEQESLPSCLQVSAWSAGRPHGRQDEEEREIMAFYHRDFPTTIGVQFHPESIFTEVGKELLVNFLEMSCAEEFMLPRYDTAENVVRA